MIDDLFSTISAPNTQDGLFVPPPRVMHDNSLEAYRSEKHKLSAREAVILTYMRSVGRAVSDREIMQGLGFSEPNMCRPRVNELLKQGLIVRTGNAVCKVTRKSVRICGVVE